MREKIILISFICILFSSCVSKKNIACVNSYSVQLDSEYLISNNEYSVNKNFHFFIKSEKPINGIFVIVSRGLINLQNYYGKNVDATYFSVGNMVITDKKEPQSLYFNSNYINNYLSSKSDSGSTDFSVEIKGFSETDDTKSIDKLYCYCFNDLNKNEIIEPDEIKQIIINVNPNNEFSEEKIYISTVGYKVKDYKKVEDRFTIYKINSLAGFNKFKESISSTVSNYAFLLENEEQFSNTNYYIVYSPITNNIDLCQPYKYTSSNLLIFDAVKDDTVLEYKYISCRNYQVKKDHDNLKICINLDGKIIYPELIEY